MKGEINMAIVETFSIVKLFKNKYHMTQVASTKTADLPRLLVIKTFSDTAQCMVRYPSGYIQRVEYQDVTTKATFTKEHVKYSSLLLEMYAAQIEWNKNHTFRAYLEQHLPDLATNLSQKVEARNKRWEEENKSKTLTVPIEVPAPPTPTEPPVVTAPDISVEPIMSELKSINDKLTALIAIWGGPNYD